MEKIFCSKALKFASIKIETKKQLNKKKNKLKIIKIIQKS
jgi:hypothetical protein